MSQHPIDISVVIPCYNAAPYLHDSIESVLRQSMRPREILFIDDGSTDGSLSIARSYAPAVRVISQRNRGVSAARNVGIDESRSGWIAFLDADDVWEENKLEHQAKAVQDAGSDLVCAYTDHYLIKHGERVAIEPRSELHKSETYHVEMLIKWVVQPSTALVRADAAQRTRFPEDTSDSEDTIYFLMLRRLGTFIRVPKSLVGYRRSGNQQTACNEHMLRSVRSRFAWFEKNRELYSEAEQREVREGLAMQLVEPHNRALRRGENQVVRGYRHTYTKITPHSRDLPETFQTPLYPRLYHLAKRMIKPMYRSLERLF